MSLRLIPTDTLEYSWDHKKRYVYTPLSMAFSLTATKLASIGIQIRHRITSHGFAINVTREPIPWFDLVTACGLDDVRATSLEGVLSGQRLASSQSQSLLSVEKVAKDLMSFLGDKFGRRIAPLQEVEQTVVASREEDIWSEIRGLIQRAEEEARERVTSSSVPRRPLTVQASP